MSVGAYLEFAGSAVLFSPKLALEDTLRYFDVDVPQKGIGYNDRGQSIMDIWNEAKPTSNLVEVDVHVKTQKRAAHRSFTIPEGF